MDMSLSSSVIQQGVNGGSYCFIRKGTVGQRIVTYIKVTDRNVRMRNFYYVLVIVHVIVAAQVYSCMHNYGCLYKFCIIFVFSLQVCHKTFKVLENTSNYCTQIISCGLDGLALLVYMYLAVVMDVFSM